MIPGPCDCPDVTQVRSTPLRVARWGSTGSGVRRAVEAWPRRRRASAARRAGAARAACRRRSASPAGGRPRSEALCASSATATIRPRAMPSSTGSAYCSWETKNGDLITLETTIAEVDYIQQYTVSHHRYEKWRNGSLIQTELEQDPPPLVWGGRISHAFGKGWVSTYCHFSGLSIRRVSNVADQTITFEAKKQQRSVSE